MAMRRVHWIAGATLVLGMAALAVGSWETRGYPSAGAAQPAAPDVVLELSWGGGGASVGRLVPDEASPEGPMSFALGPGGQVYVLDQVNERVARFSGAGALLSEVRVPCRTAQELEVMGDGTMVLLDRLVRKSLMVVSAAGQVVREVPVVGEAIEEGGLITAMMADAEGIWLEVSHEKMVRVLDASLQPASRTVRLGRPAPSGRVMAALDQRGGATLWIVDSKGGERARAQASPGYRIDRIVWVEQDAQDHVVAMFHLLEYGADHRTVLHEEVRGVRYDRDLKPRAEFRSPHVIQVWEQFREFRTGPGGEPYQMVFTDAGMKILRWRWAS